ncbi:beta-lactamase-like protein [Sulfobacillus acidophilus TPY]|uniref:Beta-lactamase-like protein n=1 Tax=Sulfobacillus acidophilus (strain ATCC 700253 / DSM 10332 / NAL) TaxID=679936 RepID=G8TYB2_SULAD|nr:beta-lactamase-like protein [Sulfobacillus acidophilus TPY]AEW05076.1 beta-lactamase-like protein [Sulfobacillus acidophilus DSM 10332]
MIFVPMHDENLGCSSFIVADEVTTQGIIVDPLGALGAEAYVLAAAELGVSVRGVIETHVHADHASAARDVADALHVPIYLSHQAPAQFPFEPVHDGQVLDLGSLKVTFWETPGHTPDSISVLLTDLTRGDQPWAILSGDSLFVGDVGRPDLANPTDEGIDAASRAQFQTVHRIMQLPDFTELWPAHYGASPCGGLYMSRKPSSTIGYERHFNRFIRIQDEAEFMDQQKRLLKPPPENAAQIRSQNLGLAESVI